MANPLAKTIMNNILQNSKHTSYRSGSSKISHTVTKLDSKEEQLISNIINKRNNRATIQQGFKSSNKSEDYMNINRKPNKINLEDLINGNVKSNDTNKAMKKSNTMMTLDELAGKVKNTKESSVKETQISTNKNNTNSKDVYVKSGVVNRLEAYIPKVTLDSIGKKGSLL